MNDIVSPGLIKITFPAIRRNRGTSARKSRTRHTMTMTLYTEVWTYGPGEVGGSPLHIRASRQCGYKQPRLRWGLPLSGQRKQERVLLGEIRDREELEKTTSGSPAKSPRAELRWNTAHGRGHRTSDPAGPTALSCNLKKKVHIFQRIFTRPRAYTSYC